MLKQNNFPELLPSTWTMLRGVPLGAHNVEIPTAETQAFSEGEGTGTCEQLVCLLTVTPTYFRRDTSYALFAFPTSSEKLVFPVRHTDTGALVEYCECAVIEAVENLKVPGVETRVVTAGDVRAHFIIVPRTTDVAKYAPQYPGKRIITASHVFNLKPVAVERIDDIFQSVVTFDSETEINRAVEVVHYSGTPATGVPGGAKDVIFTISDTLDPLVSQVENVGTFRMNSKGSQQHGKHWNPINSTTIVTDTSTAPSHRRSARHIGKTTLKN